MKASLLPVLFLTLLLWPAQALAVLPSYAGAVQLVSGGQNTTFAALGDLNGDGCLDIVAVNYTSNDVSVFLGDGHGGFSPPKLFPVGSGPKAVVLCDVTGSSALDAVVPLEGDNAVAVLAGDGAGNFGSPVLYAVDQGPKQLAMADLNHDGLLDIVTANEAPNTLSVLLGQPGGGFLRLPDITGVARPRSVAIADFDEDGNADVAVASESTAGYVMTFRGDGLGGLTQWRTLAGGITPKSMTVADFNQDGHQDLAFSDESSSEVRVWLGDGAGNFAMDTDIPVGGTPKYLLATDLDRDGNTDLLTADYTSDSISVVLGDGAGGFAPPETLATGNGPKSVAVGDLNGDGALDIVTADNDGSTVSVNLSNLSAVGSASLLPSSFYGGQGASGHTTLTYTVVRSASVSVAVRNALGATVRTLQPPTDQQPGSYALAWDGSGDGGANLAEGVYAVVIDATIETGTAETTAMVKYYLTPFAGESALGLDASGRYVLHTVIEKWSETLGGQIAGDYYFDGLVQPWEFSARSGASLTLYVGADGADPQDVSSGGAVNAVTDAQGVADLAFPDGLSWQDASGAPVGLFYSLKVSFGGSTRWYPASGRYALRPPTTADGHVKFVFMADVQTAMSDAPTPDTAPVNLDAAQGLYEPYSAIPRLSRTRGWASVLAGLRTEFGVNLVLGGGDMTSVGGDSTAPDDGTTQLRSLFDNQQSFAPTDEWSLNSLADTTPVAFAPGNHDGINSAAMVARWERWVYTPNGLPYYSFDQGDVHFVVLDNYYVSSDPATDYKGWIGFQAATAGGSRSVMVSGVAHTFTNSAQADWLLGALDTTKPWTVVAMHYPMFDSAGGPYSDTNQTGTRTATNMYYYGERDRLLALFAAHGVDLVLQGHLHYYRRHLEKVHTADGAVTTAQTYVTDGLAGGPPDDQQKSVLDPSSPYLDWVDLNHNGVRDAGEPLATSANDHWDAGHFGKMNSSQYASGYFGIADMFHPTAQEYDNGLSFSYSVFETGTDTQGKPTLTLTVKRISWDATTHDWGPWAVYETTQIPQLDGSFVANRLVLKIISLTPAAGRIGSQVTITGTAFGATSGSVTFRGRTATVTSWSDTQVVCRVPSGLSGVVPVVLTTADALASAPTNFSVKPHVGSLLPARGRVGITLTITGTGFGAHRGTSKVYFGSKAATTYVSWSATKIKVKVPKLAKGKKSVTVKTAGGRSNAKTFTVN